MKILAPFSGIGLKTSCILGLVILTSGCATERYHFTEEATAERRFAVREIMAEQIVDLGASERNSRRLPEPEDGQRAINTLKDYREGQYSNKRSSNSAVTFPDAKEIFQ